MCEICTDYHEPIVKWLRIGDLESVSKALRALFLSQETFESAINLDVTAGRTLASMMMACLCNELEENCAREQVVLESLATIEATTAQILRFRFERFGNAYLTIVTNQSGERLIQDYWIPAFE